MFSDDSESLLHIGSLHAVVTANTGSHILISQIDHNCCLVLHDMDVRWLMILEEDANFKPSLQMDCRQSIFRT